MERQKFTTQMTLSALRLRNNRGELIIPKVQRDLVWTLSQKQLLIDSLIKDFDIPKVYFREVRSGEEKKFEIIDGQQRLNAIFDFMDDKYPLPKDSDPFEDEETADKIWSQLSTDLQIILQSRSLDVVTLQGYTDAETDETFLRLQNGTPLKAPEKRRAIPGNMRDVVETLSNNSVFGYCEFSNSHYAFEDVTAKALRLLLEGGPTNISANSLSRMYTQYSTITLDNAETKKLKRAYNFLDKAFKNTDKPHLRKYALMDLTVIASELLNIYDLAHYAQEFGEIYNTFSNERMLNAEKPEEEQDPLLVAYSNAARGDSLEFITFRQDLLRRYLLEKMPYLILKDNNRNFTPDQRAVIYRLYRGVCQECGKHCEEEEFEADHIKPWSKGGPTQIANGQVLCISCNREKSDKLKGGL